MVIQRNWKTASNTTENVQHTSSSEDSNSSWQTLSNSTNSGHNKNIPAGVNALVAVAVALPQMPPRSFISNAKMAESVHRAMKQRYNGKAHILQTNAVAALSSMELMRQNVQNAFDRDIDTIIKKYVDSFFKPALHNVKENLGENAISEDCLQKLSCALLENSKAQYGSPSNTVQIKTEPCTFQSPSATYSHSIKSGTLKRKESSTLSEDTDQEPIKKLQTNIQLKSMGRTKQVYWNVSHLNTETLFLLDYKANRALGFADNSRERLASKHPELIRYLPDLTDKEWLCQQKIIVPANRSSRFLLLVHSEVCKIAATDEYRGKAKLSELDGFKLPEFILQKMKIFFTELSLRSQSFLVNSHQQQQQQQQQSLVATTHHLMSGQSTMTNTVTTSSAASGCSSAAGGMIKSRSSLSSSHATLSALLSNSGEAQQHDIGIVSMDSSNAMCTGISSTATKKDTI